jgi:hypothetical protein
VSEVDRRGNPVRHWPQAWPVIRGQHDNGQTPACEILLMADILVASEQDIETPLAPLHQVTSNSFTGFMRAGPFGY